MEDFVSEPKASGVEKLLRDESSKVGAGEA